MAEGNLVKVPLTDMSGMAKGAGQEMHTQKSAGSNNQLNRL